jgi:uncharacterized surface protein with fasciclin (FAS1) repeats
MSMPSFRLTAAACAASLAVWPLASLAQDAPAAPAAAPAAPAAAPAIPASPHVTPSGNMIATLQGSGHFSILLKALAATGLTDTLKATPNITLFAPTDDAFQALPPAQLSGLMAPKNAPVLQKVLIYHLVNLNIDSSKIKGAKGDVPTVESAKVALDGSGDVLKVNDADIIQPDVRVTNGIIHVIDKVLVPSDVSLPTVAADTAAPTPATGG